MDAGRKTVNTHSLNQSINQPFIKTIFVISSKQYEILSAYYVIKAF